MLPGHVKVGSNFYRPTEYSPFSLSPGLRSNKNNDYSLDHSSMNKFLGFLHMAFYCWIFFVDHNIFTYS